ncbi:hypothetical protein [Halorientalis sp.]|uniref:hypothetical protein n=1 Tax=Halorientalis sp. TaxID=1931229 RepID=UPI0026030F2C|nr:hypothetical protein [Halorientalis sp.]
MLNVLNALCILYAVRAAVRRRPVHTALATAGAMAPTFPVVDFAADYYDRHATNVTPE